MTHRILTTQSIFKFARLIAPIRTTTCCRDRCTPRSGQETEKRRCRPHFAADVTVALATCGLRSTRDLGSSCRSRGGPRTRRVCPGAGGSRTETRRKHSAASGQDGRCVDFPSCRGPGRRTPEPGPRVRAGGLTPGRSSELPNVVRGPAGAYPHLWSASQLRRSGRRSPRPSRVERALPRSCRKNNCGESPRPGPQGSDHHREQSALRDRDHRDHQPR